MVTVLLDSDVLIDLLKDRAKVAEWLEGIEGSGERLVLCAPVLAEVLRGAPRGGAGRVADLAASTDVLPFDTSAATRYAQIMGALDAAGRPIAALDGQIAAIALEHGGRLATRNRKHFERVPGLDVLSPPK